MKKVIRNGIRLYFRIPRDIVADFLEGKPTRVWPINPGCDCTPCGFSTGETLIGVDPDKVDIKPHDGDHAYGIFTIQRKDVKSAKPAGKHDCNSFFCRAGRANGAKPKARKDPGPNWLFRDNPLETKGALSALRRSAKKNAKTRKKSVKQVRTDPHPFLDPE